jgi:hypothetical protein
MHPDSECAFTIESKALAAICPIISFSTLSGNFLFSSKLLEKIDVSSSSLNLYNVSLQTIFEHMVTYATTPPLLPETFENSHGMRFWQADVLNTLGSKYNVSAWNDSSILFRRSGERIMQLCKAALRQEKRKVSDILVEIVNIEE